LDYLLKVQLLAAAETAITLEKRGCGTGGSGRQSSRLSRPEPRIRSPDHVFLREHRAGFSAWAYWSLTLRLLCAVRASCTV